MAAHDGAGQSWNRLSSLERANDFWVFVRTSGDWKLERTDCIAKDGIERMDRIESIAQMKWRL